MAKTAVIFLLLFVATFFELAKAINNCTWGFYNCATNSQCILSSNRCDGTTQCYNGQDERNCPSSCSPSYYNYYKCSNGVCISRRYLCNGVNNCADGSDETNALCGGTAFQVRLVGGRSSSEGRVEVYYSPERTWGTICDDGWDINDAKVVCRQLGLPRATQAVDSARFGQGTGPILLDNVQCTGSELTLSKCSSSGWKIHNCGHHEDAGVVCGGSPLPSPTGQSRLTCYLCHSPSSCQNPRSHQCSAGVRNCIKSKGTTTTGGQETNVESAVCDVLGTLCSSSIQNFCGNAKNCKRQCCSTSYCNDPRNGYASAESTDDSGPTGTGTKCYTCTPSTSYEECKSKSVLRTCESGQSTCYKADYKIDNPTTGPYGQSGTRIYGKGCVSSSQCTKDGLSFCNRYGVSSSDCNVHCCTGDGCNAGSRFEVSGVLISACAVVLALLF